MKRGLITIMVIIASIALTAGIVRAASEHNVTYGPIYLPIAVGKGKTEVARGGVSSP